MPAVVLSFLRFLVAGVGICAFFLLKGEKLPPPRTLMFLCGNGFLTLGMSNVLVCWAEQYVSSGMAAIISALVPFWIAILSVVVLKSAMISYKAVIGLFLGFLGIIGIFSDHLTDLANPNYRWGVIAIIGSTLFWSVGSILFAKYKVKVNVFFGAGIQMAFSGMVLMVYNYASGDATNLLEIHYFGYLSIIYLAIFGSLIGYVAYLYALARLPATRISVYAYVNPIVALLLGWVILGEKLNAMIGLSALVTLYGVYLVNKELKKK